MGKKEYLDGGIADSIPIEKALSMGYDKLIVVLTRPLEYRKKETKKNILYKYAQKKYGVLADVLYNRASNYNKSLDKIIELEKKQEIFVIRPTESIKVKRLEKNVDKIKDIYNLGLDDCNKVIVDLEKYLSSSNK